LGAIADVNLEALLARGDRETLVAELADDVEGLLQRLFERDSQRIGRHGALDLCPNVRCRLEEAVGGHEAVESLVRPLKIVVRQEVYEPLLRVDGVREHGAAEELVPQRLPESLDLAERLRMLWPTSDVVDAHPRQRLLELGLASPHRVLPAVVSEHLRRLPVRRDAGLERLHHERRLLMVCERVADDETAVVVHEDADVQPLVAPQPKREDVRLPQLVRRRALEAPRTVLARRRRARRGDQPLLVEDPPDLLFGHADGLKPREHVANTSRAPGFVFALQRDDLVLDDRIRVALLLRLAALGDQCLRAALAERHGPLLHGRRRYSEGSRNLVNRRALHPLLNHQQLVLGGDLSATSPLSLRLRHPVSSSADVCRRVGEEGAR